MDNTSILHAGDAHRMLESLANVAAYGMLSNQVMGDADQAAHGRSDVARWSEYAIDDKSSAVLNEMRATLMFFGGNLSRDEQSQLFRINHLCERFFWLLAHVHIDEFARLEKA